MPYVKLDCGMLDSTIWMDRIAREIFITALLMAIPEETMEVNKQIEIGSLKETGFEVPPGWYGKVPASGSGIIRRAGIELSIGMEALKRLGSPDKESRTPDFDGRRMIRVDGGFLILNFDKYRRKDHTSAERSRRWRERKRHAVASGTTRVSSRSDTQAEAEAEADSHTLTSVTKGTRPKEWPKLDTVLQFAATNGILQDCAERWWLGCDGRGGCDNNGQTITNWPSALLGFWVGWRGRIQSQKQDTPASQQQDSKVYWEAKSKYDMVCSEIKAIEDRAPTDAMHNMFFSEPDKSNRIKLIQQRKELRKQLGLTQ